MLAEAQALAAEVMATAGGRETWEELVAYYAAELERRDARQDRRPVSDDGF